MSGAPTSFFPLREAGGWPAQAGWGPPLLPPRTVPFGGYNAAVKKRLLHGLGMALLLASPVWLTLETPPNYFSFGISLSLGILLNVLALLTEGPKSHPDR